MSIGADASVSLIQANVSKLETLFITPIPACPDLAVGTGWGGEVQVRDALPLAIRGWRIVIGKQHRDPADYDLRQLARASAEFTGAEIEAVYLAAMFAGFERGQEPTDHDIAVVLNESVPLSRMMAEQIAGLKHWAKGRARMATQVVSSVGTRKLAV